MRTPIRLWTVSAAVTGLLASPVLAIDKENNTDDLNLGSSWVGGVAPGAADVATWTSTVIGPNAVNLGADLEWSQLQIQNPGGAVTINGANTLTLAANDPFGTGTNLVDLQVNAPLSLSGFTGSKFLQGPATGTKFTLNGAITLDPGVTRINFDTGGGKAGTWELGGTSSFTAEVRLGGSGNRLGIGSSSTASGGPLGAGTFIIGGGSTNIYTYAYGGNRTISNAVQTTTTPYFSGSDNLTLAGQVDLNPTGTSTRGFRNLGSATVTLAEGFINGAIQVLQGKFALAGASTDPTGGGTSGNTKVQGVGSELILLSGGSINNRVRGHDSGTLTVKPTVPNGVFTVRFLQMDSNPTKPTLAFDFTAAAPSATTAPLNAPTAKSEIYNPTDVLIRGTATSFLLGAVPLIQYAPGTSIQMGNLPPNGGAVLILPPGLEATLQDSSSFPNTLELVVTSTNAFPPPPTITVQPADQAVPEGANATFSVTAVGGTPNLSYQWYDPSFQPISWGTQATLTITNVTAAKVGDYTVYVSNDYGTTPSDAATLSIITPYTLPEAVFWTGSSNQNASDLGNYGTNSVGQGSPVATLAGKVLEYAAQFNVATLSMNADAISIGAFHSNTNRAANNGYAMGGSGPWTISGATVESAIGTISNAAVVIDHPGGGGWRLTPDLILEGGGEFVFSWNNDNWGEIQGNISESGGVADLIFTGNGTPILNTGGSLSTSGKIIVTNSTDLAARYDFDISGGPGSGELIIYNDASHFDLGSGSGRPGGVSNYFKVKTLTCVGGAAIPAGVYSYDDLVALGVGGYFYGNAGGGDLIEVTVGAKPPANAPVIASSQLSGGNIILTVTNGTSYNYFDLLSATSLNPPIAWTTNNDPYTLLFDVDGNATLTNPVSQQQEYFRIQETRY